VLLTSAITRHGIEHLDRAILDLAGAPQVSGDEGDLGLSTVGGDRGCFDLCLCMCMMSSLSSMRLSHLLRVRVASASLMVCPHVTVGCRRRLLVG